MPTNICVLKTGGDFTPDHVRLLAKQIDNLVCLSDVDIDGVEVIKLKHNWKGWFSKFELFRPDIKGDLLYFDLDTVIVGDISSLRETKETTLLNDFYRPEMPASGLMYLKESDRAKVWEYWTRNPVEHMNRARTRECWGDQGILRKILGDGVARWGDEAVSYKVHCKNGVPKSARVVCFHGKPRPWELKTPLYFKE